MENLQSRGWHHRIEYALPLFRELQTLGRALYKQRLMSGSIALAEGSVIASPVRAAVADLRARSESWLRRSPFLESARRVRRALSAIGSRLPILQRVKNIRRFR
jgi:hypothetical protein